MLRIRNRCPRDAGSCVKLVYLIFSSPLQSKGGLRLHPVEKLIVRGSESEFYRKAFRRVARRYIIAVSYGAEKEKKWGGGGGGKKKGAVVGRFRL